jgi:YVTN family beta-propeller protein
MKLMMRLEKMAGIVITGVLTIASDVGAQSGLASSRVDLAAAQEVAYVAIDTGRPGDAELGVLDLATNAIIGSLEIRPLRIAFSPDGRLAYVVGEGSRQPVPRPTAVFVIDAIRHVVLTSIPMEHPTGIAVSPDGMFAYVTHYEREAVSVISTGTNSVVTRIGVGRAPDFVAFTPDGREAYVANLGDGTISVIEVQTHTVSATIPTFGAAPRHIAFTTDGAYAYVGHLFSSGIAVIEVSARRVVASVVISATHSDGVVHRPGSTETYIMSQGADPILRILDRGSNVIVAEVPINSTSLADAAFSEDGSRAYITGSSAVHVLDATTRTELRAISGTTGHDIEVRPMTPVLNHLSALTVTGTSCCLANQFVVAATLTNTSTIAIRAPFFQVASLTEGNLLANADYAPGGFGATLTPDVGDDEVLSPGESRSIVFTIDLNTRSAFQFIVDIRGRTP